MTKIKNNQLTTVSTGFIVTFADQKESGTVAVIR